MPKKKKHKKNHFSNFKSKTYKLKIYNVNCQVEKLINSQELNKYTGKYYGNLFCYSCTYHLDGKDCKQ